LTNTKISSEGIGLLKKFPYLKSLTVGYGNKFTIDSLKQLRTAPALAEIRIVDQDIAANKLAELKAELTNCRIYETYSSEY
jgi:hypothetical protein